MFDHNETLQEARERNIRDALFEDVGVCDWTAALVASGQRVKARLIVREEAVLCGREWFEGCLLGLDASAHIDWAYDEGALMAANTPVCAIEADARALLTAERPGLNFLQTLSAVATVTRRHMDAIEGASPNPRGCVVLDTRKTLPGLRLAQKYAVRVGGGANQRLALYDGILIKENHIASAGSVTAALRRAQALVAEQAAPKGYDIGIQIEVENLDQLREAFARIPFVSNGQTFHCSFSAGITSGSDSQQVDIVVDHADQALYQAKGAGRNQVILYQAPLEDLPSQSSEQV